ncbi:MAG: 2-oxo acid dehydrogenase subunit E2 [Porticoccaceae bacterium]
MAVEIVRVPDLGGADEVEVIEIPVKVGDQISIDDTIVVLESEKATMELPAPFAGRIVKILVAEGDKITAEGVPIMELEVEAESTVAGETEAMPSPSQKLPDPDVAPKPEPKAEVKAAPKAVPKSLSKSKPQLVANKPAAAPVADDTETTLATADTATDVYAGPYVRRLARELGVDLSQVPGSGPRQRIIKEDVHKFIKQRIANPQSAGSPGSGGTIPSVPDIEFTKFGDIETQAMSKIAKLTAANMQRSWLNVPHVTQFDDADITELEEFRQSLKAEGERRGVKITPVPFLLKACALALQENPVLNRALRSDGQHFVQKNYFNIGMAVDTPKGLMVPVIRDVNQKGIWELATEIFELADKARAGKLTVNDMQGGCFTVSSLGAIGGRGFTPIVNTPEVAILGVSKAAIQPVWNGAEFAPRKLLPLALSYDHRAVNGGDGGRFMTRLVELLSDIRGMVM